jgi:hypothetical protein
MQNDHCSDPYLAVLGLRKHYEKGIHLVSIFDNIHFCSEAGLGYHMGRAGLW